MIIGIPHKKYIIDIPIKQASSFWNTHVVIHIIIDGIRKVIKNTTFLPIELSLILNIETNIAVIIVGIKNKYRKFSPRLIRKSCKASRLLESNFNKTEIDAANKKDNMALNNTKCVITALYGYFFK